MAGLGWAVKLKSGLPFQGRDALVEAATAALPRLLVGFAVEDPKVALLGRETIYRDGERVGWLSSGGFGYSVGKPIGYGYVRNPAGSLGGVDRAFALGGNYELDVAGERVRASASLAPFYDPSGARVRL
jgi:4-methylaminobutanoate oxidase (formaldehyde-forming)